MQDAAPVANLPLWWTTLFAAALVLMFNLKLWLNQRQQRHIAAHRGAVPEAFAGTITLAAHQKAADYSRDQLRLGVIELALGTAVLLGWTLLGGLDWLNSAVRSALGTGWAYQLGLVAAFALIGSLLDLPLSWHKQFGVEAKHGFNRMTPALFVQDLAKGLVVAVLLGGPLLAAMLWLMGAAGAWWWLWAWALFAGFNLLMLVLYPTVIAPMFNKFQPLADEGLKARVETLMRRCGFASKGLFVMDGSKRSAHANAYFTGFGAAKRVVFFDTLLNRLSGPEVEAVLAHELGHFKRRHITQRLVMFFAVSLLGFALLGWLATQSWFYLGLGVRPNLDAPNDALALLLFMLAVPVFTAFTSPLMAQLSRKHEFEADAYACANASGKDLAAALLKLYEDNASTLTPDPLYARVYYSHPPASERLAHIQAQPVPAPHPVAVAPA
jgi:STE24 endopeptidase